MDNEKPELPVTCNNLTFTTPAHLSPTKPFVFPLPFVENSVTILRERGDGRWIRRRAFEKRCEMKKSLIVFGVVAFVACSAAVSAQVYANHVIRKQVEEYSGNLPAGFELNAEKIRYSLIGRRAHISGISIENQTFSPSAFDRIKIDEVVVYRYDIENSMPHFAHLDINGIAVPDALVREMLPKVELIGLSRAEIEDLKVDAQSQYRFDPAGKEFISDRNDMQIRGLAGFKLKFHLVNIDLAIFQQQAATEMNPFMLIAAIGNIRMVSADMLLEVGALTNKVFEGLAKNSSISVEDLKEKISSKVSAAMKDNPGISGEMGGNILDFIKEPGDMKVTLSPEKPVSVLEVLSMSERGDLLAQALNIRIEKL